MLEDEYFEALPLTDPPNGMNDLICDKGQRVDSTYERILKNSMSGGPGNGRTMTFEPVLVRSGRNSFQSSPMLQQSSSPTPRRSSPMPQRSSPTPRQSNASTQSPSTTYQSYQGDMYRGQSHNNIHPRMDNAEGSNKIIGTYTLYNPC
jgi:hypothetical protein